MDAAPVVRRGSVGNVAATAAKLYTEMFTDPPRVMSEYGLPQLRGHACVTSTRTGKILKMCWTSTESTKQERLARWGDFQRLAAAHPEIMGDPSAREMIKKDIFHITRRWVADSEPWLSLVESNPNLRAGLRSYVDAVDRLLAKVGLTKYNREGISQLIPMFEELVPVKCCVMLAILWKYALPESQVTFCHACLKRRGSDIPRVIDFATNNDVLSISPGSAGSNVVEFVTVERFT